jgi:alpha-D-ribose 1-methylphosphonate 5-triphosphate diphosphatase
MTVVANGRIVTPDRVLDDHDLLVEHGAIAAIVPREERPATADLIDAAGGWVMPGFIDMHADYIEHMASPRPNVLMDFDLALRVAERELATHGITTMFHSLSFYGHSDFGRGPMRKPANARRFIGLVESAHRQRHLIRHRFHARFEIDSLDRVEELEGYLRAGTVHLVSFMDHTPGQGQYLDLEIYRSTLKAWHGLADDEVDETIRSSRARQMMSLEHITAVSRLARSRRIAVASHDDDSVEKIGLVQSFGATISEFPTTLEVAREARRRGMHVVAGAPNVLLGGSHSGNLSAAEAVREGCVDILCSDYYPPAMLHALFELARGAEERMPELVKLVTLHPAQAVNMDQVIGSLAPGKKADLVIVQSLDKGFPVLTHTMVDGKVILGMAYREGAA